MSVTLTENNAVQYTTSKNSCLDLFANIGAYRNAPKSMILERFKDAFEEDPKIATTIVFWARAAREGAGERNTFHTILENLPEEFIGSNANAIANLGYWKDLLRYFHIPSVVMCYAKALLAKDRLACKWAPRKGQEARQLRDANGWTNKQYRIHLKDNSETVEQQMSTGNWKDIKYSSVPGKAMRTYSSAYNKHDETRFNDWKEDKHSKAAVSASYPHDVIKTVFDGMWIQQDEEADWTLAQKQWDSLTDYVKEGENILPMSDVSGSMSGLPMLVSVSLGMYLAAKNKGQFNNTFLTFSARPELVKLTGSLERDLPTIANANWDMNTDFEKAFKSILDTAIAFNVPQEDMPTMLLVLSDMQFDQSQNGRNRPHFQLMKEDYEEAGYTLPKLVFWNLRASSCTGSPARTDDSNVALVSGFSPVLMKAILAVEDFNPMDVMIEALTAIKVDFKYLPTSFEHNEARKYVESEFFMEYLK
tara:strand:- start:1170 stop:2597 length:1428 start_codon:yes stop_codon:yes gene_type:complete